MLTLLVLAIGVALATLIFFLLARRKFRMGNTIADELRLDIEASVHDGRRNFRLVHLLYFISVTSSLISSICIAQPQLIEAGADGNLTALFAIIAGLPAVAIGIINTLRLDERGEWFYHKAQAARTLLRRMRDEELPEGEASRAYSDFCRQHEPTFPGFHGIGGERGGRPLSPPS